MGGVGGEGEGVWGTDVGGGVSDGVGYLGRNVRNVRCRDIYLGRDIEREISGGEMLGVERYI